MFNYPTFNQLKFNSMPEGRFGRWFSQRYITSPLSRTSPYETELMRSTLPEVIIEPELPEFVDSGSSLIASAIMPQEDLLTSALVSGDIPEIHYDDIDKKKRDSRDILKDFE